MISNISIMLEDHQAQSIASTRKRRYCAQQKAVMNVSYVTKASNLIQLAVPVRTLSFDLLVIYRACHNRRFLRLTYQYAVDGCLGGEALRGGLVDRMELAIIVISHIYSTGVSVYGLKFRGPGSVSHNSQVKKFVVFRSYIVLAIST